ncbi:MAG: hypothetical protein ACLFQJ_06320, partial [Campylobacterales bacterium]
MDITVKLSKKHVRELVAEVVDPFYSKVLNDEHTKKFISDPNLLKGLKIKQVTFATYFYVYPLERIRDKVAKSSSVHKDIKLEMEFFAKYFFIWAELIQNFIINHFDTNDATMNLWKLKLQKLLWMMTKNYSPTMKAEVEKEIESIEKGIDTQSFYENKISAKKFLEEYEADKDTIDELEELYKDIDDMFEVKDELDDELYSYAIAVFDKYGAVLDATIEFRELGYALEGLARSLEDKKIVALKDDKKKFVAVFIKSIIDDLENWRDRIFIAQDTLDIHYLDDSFFSSIAQLEVTIEG